MSKILQLILKDLKDKHLTLTLFIQTVNDIKIKKENKEFKETKSLISNASLIRQSFQGYGCKSGIVIFARNSKLCLQSL